MERELLENQREVTIQQQQNNFLQSTLRTSNKFCSRYWNSSSFAKFCGRHNN